MHTLFLPGCQQHYGGGHKPPHGCRGDMGTWDRQSVRPKVIRGGPRHRRQLPADLTLESREEGQGTDKPTESGPGRSTLASLDKASLDSKIHSLIIIKHAHNNFRSSVVLVELKSEIASTRPPGRRSDCRPRSTRLTSILHLPYQLNFVQLIHMGTYALGYFLSEHSSHLLCCLKLIWCSCGAFYRIRLRLTSLIK